MRCALVFTLTNKKELTMRNEALIRRLKIILHWNYCALRSALAQGVPAESLAVDFLFRERTALKRRIARENHGV